MAASRQKRRNGVTKTKPLKAKCLECRVTMTLAQLRDDQHGIDYEGYQCPKCGHTVVTLDQMRAYNSIRELKREFPYRRKIVKVGSSLGLTLPASLRDVGLEAGQEVEITILDPSRIQIEFCDINTKR